jgi:hypothetical protein
MSFFFKFFHKVQVLREMAALPGRENDPNADEKSIVEILHSLHEHPDAKKRTTYINHPEGVRRYAEDHLMTGHDEYDRGTRLAASAAQAIMNHSTQEHGTVRDIFKRRTAVIERSGIRPAVVQDEYKKLGGKNTTSRADITISCFKTGAKHSFSVKKGDAQFASAEAGEFASLGHAATDAYTRDPKIKDDIKKRINSISSLQKKSETAASDEEYYSHAKKANDILQKLRRDHPQWEHHVAREGSTGHAKFGKGQEGSADNLLSYDDKTGEAKIWKSEDGGTPFPNGLKMEIRAGKGRKGTRDPKEAAKGIDTRRRRQIAFRAEPLKPAKGAKATTETPVKKKTSSKIVAKRKTKLTR